MMKGMGSILKQAQKFQEDIARVQGELAEKSVEGSAGGGVVVATVNGRMEVLSVKIEPEVVDPDDSAMLEDLTMAAVNDALKKARELAAAELTKITGGIPIPGIANLFG